jgi:hypothetical protein
MCGITMLPVSLTTEWIRGHHPNRRLISIPLHRIITIN